MTDGQTCCANSNQPLSGDRLFSLGSFSIVDEDGSENIAFMMNSRFFKHGRVYSNSLKISNVGEFPWS